LRLNAPTQWVFIIAVIIAIIGLIAWFGWIPLAGWAFWIMTLAFVVLAVACLIPGA
jgi:hypothetical protein